MLSRIRSLRDAAGNREVRGLSAKQLESLDKQICTTILDTVTKTLPDTNTPYHSLARILGNQRFPPHVIFTTNYDLLIEQAMESLQVPFFDGFVGSHHPFFDQRAIEDDMLPERWALLWKLHGSINWRFSRETNAISRSVGTSAGDELLIHPSHLKYDESRRMPYLVMIDRLKAFLRNRKLPVVLLVLGHSFSDDHLNATLLEGLKANPNAACYALQFGNLSDYPTAVRLARLETNLSLLAKDGAVISRRRGSWLAQPTTDRAALDTAFEFLEPANNHGIGVADESDIRNEDPDAPRACQFLLGDFQRFGDFLDKVAGHTAIKELLESDS